MSSYTVTKRRCVVNQDESGYLAAKKRADLLNMTKRHESEISTIKSELSEIKELLLKIIGVVQ